ncbi:MAG: M18 family aminopeptidase [Lachnospiraceae bacterium]|nr:M18 family aminopeptidase [Lachnospiraceae bacterium]
MGDLLNELLINGTSPYHVGEFLYQTLTSGENGNFSPLDMRDEWKLEEGRGYLVNLGSTIIAFRIPKDRARMLPDSSKGRDASCLRITASHVDYPGFRIKSDPDMADGGYVTLDTEVYGGPIDSSWLDRPLGVAGMVTVSTDDPFQVEEILYDSKRGLLTIPNLAIHMDREINKGKTFNRQTQLIPLFSASEDEESFEEFLASDLGVEQDRILSWDLCVYNEDRPQRIGRDYEMLSAPRIDNLSSVAACLSSMLRPEEAVSLEISAFFNHEEIGSTTREGADSNLLSHVIQKIYDSFGFTEAERLRAVYDGYLLSVDVAHAFHPNYKDKADPKNRPVINRGFAVKEAFSQSYATDPVSIGILKSICQKEGIPCQSYFNRSDIPGGHTLGVYVASHLPMHAADIGLPILAMHSARELCGMDDYISMERFLRAFYNG